jgi:exodeoxyribonuclease (lambda-induced)
MEQRSPEWYAARLGVITASSADRIVTINGTTKKMTSSPYKKQYLYKLIAEIMTGQPEVIQVTPPMQRGIDLEGAARDRYIEETGNDVKEVGFCKPLWNLGIGCSPDGLIGDDGMLELKCPGGIYHTQYMLEGPKREYIIQMQFQMMCSGRKWCDFGTYNPDFKSKDAQFGHIRIERNEDMIGIMKKQISSLQKDVREFIKLYGGEYNY